MLNVHHLAVFADAWPLVHLPHSPVSNTIGSQSSPRGIKRRSRSPEYDIAGERLDEGTADFVPATHIKALHYFVELCRKANANFILDDKPRKRGRPPKAVKVVESPLAQGHPEATPNPVHTPRSAQHGQS